MTKSGISVAVDLSAESDAAVRWAAREALLREANVTLVHVVAPVVVTCPSDTYARVMPSGKRKTFSTSSNRHRRSFSRSGQRDPASGQSPSTTRLCRSRTCRSVPGCGDDRRGQPKPGCDQWDIAGFRQPHVATPRPLPRCDHSRERSRCTAQHRAVGGRHRRLTGIRGSHGLGVRRASRRHVDLVALHAWSDVGITPVMGMDWHGYEGLGHEVLAERLAGWQEQYPDVQTQRRIVCDRPARWLVDESEDFQLVVVGSHGRGGFAGMLLGSVSTAVAEAAKCPVLVVRRLRAACSSVPTGTIILRTNSSAGYVTP